MISLIDVNKIKLSWNKVKEEQIRGFLQYYRVIYQAFSQGDVQLDPRPYPVEFKMQPSSDMFLLLENLTIFTTYEVSVSVVNGRGEGPRTVKYAGECTQKINFLL